MDTRQWRRSRYVGRCRTPSTFILLASVFLPVLPLVVVVVAAAAAGAGGYGREQSNLHLWIWSKQTRHAQLQCIEHGHELMTVMSLLDVPSHPAGAGSIKGSGPGPSLPET